METILIIEDDTDIRQLLHFNLQAEGFSVLEAANGKDGLEMARRHKPSLILLDVMLPLLDGFGVCKELGRDPVMSAIPILMLTARGEEVDRIVGLELGADDYVVKPFSMRELLLRIRAILRRHSTEREQPAITLGSIMLDAVAHSVRVGSESIALTATEFRLLEDLMRHAGSVRTREQLLNAVWGYQFEGYARTVDTHIRRLRAKLGEGADVLETVRGIGYRAKVEAL